MSPSGAPDPSAPPARQRGVLVVGAGRSGTSALTRGVQALGVELGRHLRAPTGKNPTGFFEDRDLIDVAKRVRSRLGLRSESVALLSEADWRDTPLEDLRKEAVALLADHFAGAPVWGFKYSQTLRFLPFWEAVLREAGVEPAYVMALRSPLSVARSRRKLDARRGRQAHSDLEWLVNVVPYFRRMAASPTVVVDFDLLMGDPAGQLERVATGLGLPLDEPARARVAAYADSFLREDMRHTRFDDTALADPALNPVVRDAYRLLRRVSCDELRLDDDAFRSAWEPVERSVAELAPVLAHVDRLEAELRSLDPRPLAFLRRLRTRFPRPPRR